ncbi:hypothetical protein [Paenibacillus sp. FSL L8-0709]|uniref:hypothetical protein n=1 Tax=Paenibacillus sp. FSL L8-0709 TaxID=2975312 RepID=UPI0030F9D3E7
MLQLVAFAAVVALRRPCRSSPQFAALCRPSPHLTGVGLGNEWEMGGVGRLYLLRDEFICFGTGLFAMDIVREDRIGYQS